MSKLPICAGTGLLALDVILNGSLETPPKFQAGGSCGNVLTILSFLGWDTFPIARLAPNKAGEELLNDLSSWKVYTDLIVSKQEGSTPIIIHRILKDRNGKPVHKFEFRDPTTGLWLPRYKPVLAKDVEEISNKQPIANAFYFDRVNRASIELARINKMNGAIVIFEPSSTKDIKLFKEALDVTHILKFSKDRIPDYQELFPNQQAFLEIETLGKAGLRYRFSTTKNARSWKTLGSYEINDSMLKDSAGAGDWCTAGIISQLCSKGIEHFVDQETYAIENALNYGQALGALNCCFDGARGIMYNIDRTLLDKAVFSLQEDSVLIDSIFESSFHMKASSQKLISVTSLF